MLKVSKNDRDQIRQVVKAAWIFVASVGYFVRCENINRENLLKTSEEVSSDIDAILYEPK